MLLVSRTGVYGQAPQAPLSMKLEGRTQAVRRRRSSAAANRANRVCSVCGAPGHNRRTCPLLGRGAAAPGVPEGAVAWAPGTEPEGATKARRARQPLDSAHKLCVQLPCMPAAQAPLPSAKRECGQSSEAELNKLQQRHPLHRLCTYRVVRSAPGIRDAWTLQLTRVCSSTACGVPGDAVVSERIIVIQSKSS